MSEHVRQFGCPHDDPGPVAAEQVTCELDRLAGPVAAFLLLAVAARVGDVVLGAPRDAADGGGGVDGGPAAGAAACGGTRLRELGVLTGTDGPYHNVLKIRPPLVFTDADADLLVATLDEVLATALLKPGEHPRGALNDVLNLSKGELVQ